MIRSWIFALSILAIVSASCPLGFTLQYDGICTKLEEDGTDHVYDNLNDDAIEVCNYDGASTPIIIRNKEDQDYWANIASTHSYPLVIGIRCNEKTEKFEWDDGSKLTYKPANAASMLSDECTRYYEHNWVMLQNGDWEGYASAWTNKFVIYCMKSLPPVAPADKVCGDFVNEDGDCYQIGTTAQTWSEAQTICKSFGGNVASVHSATENANIRRLAVSKGQVNGLLLGASLAGDTLTWIDGTPMDYYNFMPGFPVAGMGQCVAMNTNEVNGRWVNTDCSQNMPFACVRRANDTEPVCGDHVYTEGEIIHSPGFPSNSSIPCDFFLKVDANKKVEVEILILEANVCCDRLILAEGSLGGKVIADLTGEISAGAKYRTSSSNMMRVSWQPNGGVNVRGMMITFRGV